MSSTQTTATLPAAAPTTAVASFADLGVPTKLVSALTDNGIKSPFPIQTDTLPDTLQGRDVLGRGKTGSGKSLAFCIPLAARLSSSGNKTRPSHPRGLILAPTRELATQLTVALEPLARAANLRVTTIFGGVAQNRQVSALKGGVDIVVACPGRLEDLMRQGHVHLDAIEMTILDEADHMADLGFLPGVTRILNATPTSGQRLLFSATLDNGVDKLVKRFLSNPVMHSVDEANSPVVAMTHHIYDVTNTTAKKDLVELLASGTGRRILFMRTKHQARKLAKQLTQAGIPAVDLHGNLSQNARDRNLAAFSTGNIKVLVATDIAARGVHVDDVQLVVHVDPPAEHKAYLHRSGRTARAGSSGDVVTVVLPEQRKDVAILLRKAGIKAQPQQVTAQSTAVTGLVGETAARVTPAPESASNDSDERRQGGPRGGQRGGGPRGGGPRGGGQGGPRGGGRSGGGGRGGQSGASRSSGAATTVKYSSESQPSGGQRAAAPAGGQRRRSARPASAPVRG
ncbi:DEAD/DEAH box helicase [Tomitella biformata]|uniref:DEAD/DEAH box helicase n=1 Tax=Tomitella biformata TaxID=630403 RepID=UPI000464F25F|nr:DEAD/DEAH box helicase [Tomitella biformata]